MSTTRRVPTYQASVGAATAKDIPLVDNVEVPIPVLTNTKDISVGQELVVFWKKTVKSVAAPKPRTWQDEAAQEYRQAKKTSA